MADPLPLDALYETTTVADVALSPDGGRLAYVATEYDGDDDERRSGVFVVPTDGSREPHRLTRASDASSPTWSPDGSRLAVLAAREEDAELAIGQPDEGDDEDDDNGADDREGDDEQNGDEGPRPQVWVFDLDRGGDARQVTDRDEGVAALDWGPAGERLVVASRDPTDEQAEYLRERREEDGPVETERLQHKFDGADWLDEVRSYLFVVDLETRETRRLDDTYGRGVRHEMGGLQPAWSPDGDRIAFCTYRGEDPDDTYVHDLYTIAPDGDDLERVTEGGVSAGQPTWNDDGSRLAYTRSDPDNWYRPTELWVADVETGDRRSVSASLDRTLGYGGFAWLEDDALVGCLGDEARTRLCRFDATEDDPERVYDVQPEDASIPLCDAAGGTVAVVLSSSRDGQDCFALDAEDLGAETDERTRLTANNDDLLERYDRPETHRFTFAGHGGDEVGGLVVAPPSFDPDEPEALPTVLRIHGGPMSYDRPSYDFTDAVLTTRGYLVAKVNYRGSTSYGRDFSEQLQGAWNGADVDDLEAGVAALCDRGWADPDRLFCTGFSQGGINTAFYLTRDDPFVAAAAEHGIYDLRAAFGTDDTHVWLENDFGLPWEEPEAYDAASSLPDVGEIDTPLLVTAGGRDWRCPPSQAEQLYVSVRKQGVPAKLVVYEDEHHNVGDPDRAIHRLESILEWFERHDPALED